MQVMRPIRAMQTAGHNSLWYRQHRSRPCKKTQGRGTHCLETGNGEESEAWATRPTSKSALHAASRPPFAQNAKSGAPTFLGASE